MNQLPTDLLPSRHVKIQMLLLLAACLLIGCSKSAEDGAAMTVQAVTNSIGMRFNLLPGGTFAMGSVGVLGFESFSNAAEWKFTHEGPVHEVTLSQPFAMGVSEVTQEQYERVMGTNPSNLTGRSNPVEQVSWNDAVEFCRKLSSLPEEKSAGRVYRLPTEAEWEYACRAGTTTQDSFGEDPSDFSTYAWFEDNSDGTTRPVGKKRANAWGLYDMHGNVWEWCSDWYGKYSSGSVTDPSGASSGSGPDSFMSPKASRIHTYNRVFRGGSWLDHARDCRSARRRGGGNRQAQHAGPPRLQPGLPRRPESVRRRRREMSGACDVSPEGARRSRDHRGCSARAATVSGDERSEAFTPAAG